MLSAIAFNRRNNWQCWILGVRVSVVKIVLGVVVLMVVEPLVFDVASFHGGLDTAVAPEPLAVPAGPVYGVLVTIVDPVLVVLENKDHAAGPVRRQVVNA